MANKDRKKEAVEQANVILKNHSGTAIAGYKDKNDVLGRTEVVREKPFVALDFTGMKTRIIKSFWENGKTISYKKGSLWESIPIEHRKKMAWNESDFQK